MYIICIYDVYVYMCLYYRYDVYMYVCMYVYMRIPRCVDIFVHDMQRAIMSRSYTRSSNDGKRKGLRNSSLQCWGRGLDLIYWNSLAATSAGSRASCLLATVFYKLALRITPAGDHLVPSYSSNTWMYNTHIHIIYIICSRPVPTRPLEPTQSHTISLVAVKAP